MIRFLCWIFIFYLNIIFPAGRNIVNITVTSSSINVNNFRRIISSVQSLSACLASNYSISVIPYNETAPFASPVGVNGYFPEIHLVFGPLHYFTPSYYGFKPNPTIFKFSNTHILNSFMSLALRLQLMLSAVNEVVRNDLNQIVVFVLSGSIVDPMVPWKPFNPMQYLSTFKGSISIQSYINPGDGSKICSKILSSKTITVAMDLNRASTLDVLNACNDRNLLNWRMRWLVFFSSLSYASLSLYSQLPLRPNFTLYEFKQFNETDLSIPQIVSDEQDGVLYDIAYTVVKLMDFSECNSNNVATLKLSTGQFNFNNGVVTRTNWFLDIYQKNANSLIKIGNVTIDAATNQISLSVPNLNNLQQSLLIEMRAKPFRVAVMLEKPFAYEYVANGTRIQTGYCMDLIKTILSNLNVTPTYTFYNYSNGILNNGKLDGMLALIQFGQADIAVGPIVNNPNFKSYVDFTVPFFSYKVAIIYKVSVTNIYLDVFEFINAFDYVVWALIVGSCVIYAIVLTIVNLISPNEARFGFFYSFLFTMGSMVQGVTTALPDKISGRILVVFWWVYNLVVLLAYVANYGAILTNNRMQAQITQVGDLFLQNQYSYATVTSSAIDYYLQNSPYADIQNVNQVMRSQFTNKMAATAEIAMNSVRNNGLAFIYADIVLQNYTNEPCMTVTNGTDSFDLSFALPPNSDYTSFINDQINSLRSDIEALRIKYFTRRVPPPCQTTSWLTKVLDILGYPFLTNIMYSFNINKFAGIFVVMIIGIIISLFVAIIEFIVRKCRKGKTS